MLTGGSGDDGGHQTRVLIPVVLQDGQGLLQTKDGLVGGGLEHQQVFVHTAVEEEVDKVVPMSAHVLSPWSLAKPGVDWKHFNAVAQLAGLDFGLVNDVMDRSEGV